MIPPKIAVSTILMLMAAALTISSAYHLNFTSLAQSEQPTDQGAQPTDQGAQPTDQGAQPTDQGAQPSNQSGGSNEQDKSIIVPDGPAGEASTAHVVESILHTGETFTIQWKAQNKGETPSQAFDDSLVITRFPEGASCSGDGGTVVYNSEKDAKNPQDFAEQSIAAHSHGDLKETKVGPFDQPGKYLFSLVLGGGGQKVYNVPMGTECLDVIQGDTNSGSTDTTTQ